MRKGILWAVLTEEPAVQRLYPNGTPHHVTLFYDVLREDWEQWIDITFEAHAIGLCYNNDVQVILLDMPSHIPHKAHPHITVSYRDGVAPSASNHMLASGDYTFEPLKMAFRFKIEFFEVVKRSCNFCGVELATQNHSEFCNKHRDKVNRMTTEENIMQVEPIRSAGYDLRNRVTLLEYYWHKPQPLSKEDAEYYAAMVRDLKRFVSEMKETT
jgi:hypothetical protein